MKVLIIEDEHLAAAKLERQLTRIDASIDICGKVDSVKSAVQWFNVNKADLVFCDIHLGDGNSFSIFNQTEVKTPIIFTTAYDQYAVQAFKLNSIDYLLKPIAMADLERSLNKFNETNRVNESLDFKALLEEMNKEKEESYKQRFMVHLGEQIRSIEIQEVAYFYAEGKYVFLVCHNGKEYNLDYTLDRLTGQLNPAQFFRVNRQFIVSINCIKEMYAWSKSRIKMVLKPEARAEVVVSRERSSDFKNWLNA